MGSFFILSLKIVVLVAIFWFSAILLSDDVNNLYQEVFIKEKPV